MQEIQKLQIHSRDAPMEVRAKQYEPMYVPYILITDSLTFPPGSADAAVRTLKGDERRQGKLELRFMRGEFGHSELYYKNTAKDSALRLCAMNLALNEARAVGNFGLFNTIYGELAELCNNNEIVGNDKMLLEISYHTVQLLTKISDKDVEWQDLSTLPQNSRRSFIFAQNYDKAFRQLRFDIVPHVLEAILYINGVSEYTPHDIYLCLICSAAFYASGHNEKAREYAEAALDMALPDGFIMPLAEMITTYGNVLEQCLKERDKAVYEKVVSLAERLYNNTADIHNRLANDKLCTTLTFNQIQLARLVVFGMTNPAIAKIQNCSLASVKQRLSFLFGKLMIHSRSEVRNYIL